MRCGDGQSLREAGHVKRRVSVLLLDDPQSLGIQRGAGRGRRGSCTRQHRSECSAQSLCEEGILTTRWPVARRGENVGDCGDEVPQLSLDAEYSHERCAEARELKRWIVHFPDHPCPWGILGGHDRPVAVDSNDRMGRDGRAAGRCLDRPIAIHTHERAYHPLPERRACECARGRPQPCRPPALASSGVESDSWKR